MRSGNRAEVGDVVRLKSGGPAMTVEVVVSDQMVACCWFDGARRLSAMFRIEMLEPTTLRGHADAAREGVIN